MKMLSHRLPSGYSVITAVADEFEPNYHGMASDNTPPDCRFGMQIDEDVDEQTATEKAARIMRVPAERLVLIPGHFVQRNSTGTPPWYYRAWGWCVYVRLEDF